MKSLTFLGLVLLFTSSIAAQTYRTLEMPSWPESDKDTSMYTVKGERHGISFFKQHKHPEVIRSRGLHGASVPC